MNILWLGLIVVVKVGLSLLGMGTYAFVRGVRGATRIPRVAALSLMAIGAVLTVSPIIVFLYFNVAS